MTSFYDLVVILAPTAAFAAIILWAELTKEFLVYVLAAIMGGYAVISLFTSADFKPLGLPTVGATILTILRAIQARDELNTGE